MPSGIQLLRRVCGVFAAALALFLVGAPLAWSAPTQREFDALKAQVQEVQDRQDIKMMEIPFQDPRQI